MPVSESKCVENNKKFWEELITYILRFDMDRVDNDTSNNSSIVACVLVAAVTFLPNPCLAMIRVYTQTHRLMGGIYEVRRLDGLRCHDIHAKFHKNWFSHSKVGKGDTQTYREHGDRISLLSFFKRRKVG
jgi:hypothetical protein